MSIELIIRKAVIDDAQHLHPLMEQLGYPQSPDELQRRLELFTNELHTVFFLRKLLEMLLVGLLGLRALFLFPKQQDFILKALWSTKDIVIKE